MSSSLHRSPFLSRRCRSTSTLLIYAMARIISTTREQVKFPANHVLEPLGRCLTQSVKRVG